MEIKLDSTKQVVISAAKIQETDVLNLQYIIDDPSNKIVRAILDINGGNSYKLDLWTGDDYDNIGDWTQSKAEEKIKELS